jgi:hypothetical protein
MTAVGELEAAFLAVAASTSVALALAGLHVDAIAGVAAWYAAWRLVHEPASPEDLRGG